MLVPAILDDPDKQAAKTNFPYVFTNPDFYTTEAQGSSDSNPDIQRTTILYSTLDEVVIGQNVTDEKLSEKIFQISPNKNLIIYALRLTVVTDIVIPGGTVLLYCKEFCVPEGIKIKIDVSAALDPKFNRVNPFLTDFPNAIVNSLKDGSPGKSGDELAKELQQKGGSKYGLKGLKGGKIEIICDELNMGGILSLYGNGSKGYPGAFGQTGAQGATGADEKYEIKTYLVQGNIQYYKQTNAPPQPGQSGGKGGKSGTGGDGGDGGTINLMYKLLKGTAPETKATGGDRGLTGSYGTGGLPGPNGYSYEISSNYNKVTGKKQLDTVVNPGANGDANDNSGAKPGTETKITPVAGSNSTQLGNALSSIFCLKLLQKIKYWYMLNSPQEFIPGRIEFYDKEGTQSLKGILSWLVTILTGFYGKTDSVENIKKSSLAGEANTLLLRWGKYTYYGDPLNYVPRMEIGPMIKRFKSTYQSRTDFEKRFFDLASANVENNFKNLAKDEKIKHLQVAKAVYEDLSNQMLEEIVKQKPVVDSACHTLQTTIFNLSWAEGEIIQAISTHFNCKFEDITKGLEMLAFTGITGGAGVVMLGTEFTTFLHDGFNTIKTKNGEVSNEYEIAKFTEWQKDLKDLGSSGELLYLNGKLQDKQTQLIMVDLGKVSGELDNISESLPEKLKDKARSCIETAKRAAIGKGEAIITYNSYVSSYFNYYNKLKEATQELENLQNDKQLNDPYFTMTVSWFASLYQDMIERAIRDLYDLNRRVYFLTYTDSLGELLLQQKTNSLWTGKTLPADLNMQVITVKFDAISRNESDYFSRQLSAYQAFPSNPKQIQSSVHVLINDDRLISEFIRQNTNGEYALNFSTVAKDPKQYNELTVANEKNSFGIRIDHVQPIIIGAKRKLFSLTPPVIEALGANVSADIIAILKTLSNSLYKLNNTERKFSDWHFNEKDFMAAIKTKLNNDQWKSVGETVATAACQTTTSGNITVQILHRGNSKIVNKETNGLTTLYSFYHTPVYCELDHLLNIADESGIVQGVIGMKNEGRIDDIYLGPVGIFADWTLKVSESADFIDNNYGLDLSSVKEIIIYFRGWNQVMFKGAIELAEELSIQQKDARKFWIALQNSFALPFYLYANINSWAADSATFETSENFKTAFEKYLQDDLGLSTDMDTVMAERAKTLQKDLRFWQGTYFLFDEAGKYSVLNIEPADDIATITVGAVAISGYSFEGSVLNCQSGDLRLKLSFSVLDSASVDNMGVQMSNHHDLNPRCQGTIFNLRSNSLKNVYGRKNAYSAKTGSLEQSDDALQTWNGRYALLEITEKGLKHLDDEATFFAGPDGNRSPFLMIGKQKITIENNFFYSNCLSWNANGGEDHPSIVKFTRSYTGQRLFTASIDANGETRCLRGYKVSSLDPIPESHKKLRERKLAAGLSISPNLPDAYNLANYGPAPLTASGGASPYTWTVLSGGLPHGLSLSSDGYVYGSPNDEVNTYWFEAQVTDSTGAKVSARLPLKLDAASDTLIIVTESLPDTQRGIKFQYQLQGQGFDPTSYAWQLSSTDLQAPTTVTVSTGGLLVISLDPEMTIGDYGIKVTLACGIISTEANLVLSVTQGQDSDASLTFSGVNTVLAVAGIIVGAAAPFLLQKWTNAQAEKASKDKWEKARFHFDEVKGELEDALKEHYPQSLSDVTKSLEKVDKVMQSQKYAFEKYDQAIKTVDKATRKAFKEAIASLNLNVDSYKKGAKKKEKDALDIEKQTAEALRKMEIIELEKKWEADFKQAEENVKKMEEREKEYDKKDQEIKETFKYL